MKHIPIFLTSLSLLLSACTSHVINWENMATSEQGFNKKQRNELVAFMSLEVMFPDRRVRALAEAAGTGNIDEIIELHKNGVNVNSRGTKNATPLFWALHNFEGFTMLLELGADPNLVFGSSSVMHWAARIADTRFLVKALKHGGNPNLVAGQFSETPIFKTISIGKRSGQKTRQSLLNAGANIDAKTRGKLFGRSFSGKTPVMVAADLARFDIVYELLVLGANYKDQDNNGWGLTDRISEMIGTFQPDSEQEKWLNKVILWFAEKGIRVTLTNASSGFPQAKIRATFVNR